jgi:putative sugar O-methyltransferase
VEREYSFSSDYIKRFQKFLESEKRETSSSYAKSEYWKFHADAITVRVSGNKIFIDGKSGFYVPPESTKAKRLMRKFQVLLSEPSRLAPFLKRKLTSSQLKFLSFAEAYDAVMKHDPIAEVALSPYRINFKKLGEVDGVTTSVNQMRDLFFAKQKYALNPQMIFSYYHRNILLGYTNFRENRTIVEIGAGNGNLAALLHDSLPGSKYIIVDLPETLALSITFISDLFPKAKLLMPHEAQKENISDDYDFVFLTTNQTDLIMDSSVDLFINVMSFMEMTHKQIGEYFQLVQRGAKNDATFYTVNDVEKIPSGGGLNDECLEPPNRFAEYPWNSENKIKIYELCRFSRLTGLVEVFVRLEQIRKPKLLGAKP